MKHITGLYNGEVLVDTKPGPSEVWDGVEVPIRGDEETIERELSARDKSPEGWDAEEWAKQWRKHHNTHYMKIVMVLQADREAPRNVWVAHASLVGADFQRADLRGVNLDGVNLTNACFRGADLSGASLRGALLVKADLSRACLHMADLEGADLSGADASMAYLKGANLNGARLTRMHLRGALAQEAFFLNCDMRWCNLAGADFWGSCFDGANLEGVENIRQATFYHWLNKETLHWTTEPREGYVRVDRNFPGRMSYRGNAGRIHV